MGSGGGAPGSSGGGGELSSSARMRIDFGKQPMQEPPIVKDDDTRFDGLTGPMVTSQGKNSAILGKTFQQREQEERTMSVPRSIGRPPIPGQVIAAAPTATSMEMDPGPYRIHNLHSLSVQLANIGIASHQDGLQSSVAIQHPTDVVMQAADASNGRGSQRSQSGPSLPAAKGKRSKTSKSIGSMASADALDAGLNLVTWTCPSRRYRHRHMRG